MTDVDTAELRRLAEAATPGPWEAVIDYHRAYDLPDVSVVSRTTHEYVSEDVNGSGGRFSRNADYIAAVSPDVLVALLNRLERAEGLRT